MSEVMVAEEARAGSRLQAKNITIGYDARIISDGLTLGIPDGKFTVIVGGPTRAASRPCCGRCHGC